MLRKVKISYKKSTKVIKVDEIRDWEKVADFVIGMMKPGMIVALRGDLGAGKTTLTQVIAKQLGVAKQALSPTFALMRSYKVQSTKYKELKRLLHLDAYRIEDEADLLPLELDEELAEQGTVMLVEWSNNIPNWISKHDILIEISIEMKS